jgi:hypothetical protein
MREINRRIFMIPIILVSFSSFLSAEDKRSIPMDLYMIIDASSSFGSAKSEAVAWFSAQVVDRYLMDGDTVTIWSAGDRAELLYSGEISSSGAKSEIKNKLQSLATEEKKADFNAALRELESRVSKTAQNRFSYSMLITASAGGLETALAGNSQNLLKWFRTEKYERWQALIVAPGINQKVSAAAANYIASIRR